MTSPWYPAAVLPESELAIMCLSQQPESKCARASPAMYTGLRTLMQLALTPTAPRTDWGGLDGCGMDVEWWSHNLRII